MISQTKKSLPSQVRKLSASAASTTAPTPSTANTPAATETPQFTLAPVASIGKPESETSDNDSLGTVDSAYTMIDGADNSSYSSDTNAGKDSDSDHKYWLILPTLVLAAALHYSQRWKRDCCKIE